MSLFYLENQNLSLDSKITVGLDKIGSVFRSLLWEQAKTLGLSPIQIQILIFIKYHKIEYTTVSYLAKEFDLTKPTISDAVKVLVEKNLVSKIIDTKDSRSYTLQLTNEGMEIVLKTENFASPFQDFFSNESQEEKEILWKLLSKLLFKLNQLEVISIQRMCYTCTFYKNSNRHYCNLLQKELKQSDIRFDCPEHKIA